MNIVSSIFLMDFTHSKIPNIRNNIKTIYRSYLSPFRFSLAISTDRILGSHSLALAVITTQITNAKRNEKSTHPCIRIIAYTGIIY